MTNLDKAWAILAVIVAIPVAYYLGLALSRGWHRGKRESVSCMIKEVSKHEKDTQ